MTKLTNFTGILIYLNFGLLNHRPTIQISEYFCNDIRDFHSTGIDEHLQELRTEWIQKLIDERGDYVECLRDMEVRIETVEYVNGIDIGTTRNPIYLIDESTNLILDDGSVIQDGFHLFDGHPLKTRFAKDLSSATHTTIRFERENSEYRTFFINNDSSGLSSTELQDATRILNKWKSDHMEPVSLLPNRIHMPGTDSEELYTESEYGEIVYVLHETRTVSLQPQS